MTNAYEHMGDSGPLLLRNATLLTMDGEATVRRGEDLLVERGKIAQMGPALTAPDGARVLDLTDHLLLPGLIQGHVHLGQTIFRGLAEGRRLLPWLRERIWPLEAGHDDESAYWCSLLGAAECLLGGTTTIQEIGIGPGARGMLQAIVDSGLRAAAGMCLMDSGDGLPDGLRYETDQALAETASLGTEFHGAAGGRVSYLLNPRFILSCSGRLWRGIEELSTRHGWPVHTHALEQKEETATVRELKDGRDEIEYFDETGILSRDLRIAHGVWLDSGHLHRVSGEDFSVVHCPSSNLKLGSGIADVVALRRAGVPVGVGADGAPCNNDLDALEEVRLAALLQQLRNGPGSFSATDALRLATSEGARAIGLYERTGSLEPGKDADLLVLSLDRPELALRDRGDLQDLVVYGASRASVRHVFVGGRQLVEDGRLVGLDLGEIAERATVALDAVLRRSQVRLD